MFLVYADRSFKGIRAVLLGFHGVVSPTLELNVRLRNAAAGLHNH